MTAPLTDKRSARALAVGEALGALERACIAYVELRSHHGDHRFTREMMTLCRAFGEALRMEGL